MSIPRCASYALAVTAVITGIAAGTAGCASGKSASTDPLASDSLATIINQARVNTTATQSVHVAGWVVSSGAKDSLSLTLVPAQGCAGTMTESGVGTLGLIWIGKAVWVNAQPMPAGEYMKTARSNSGIKSATSGCLLSNLLSGVTATGNIAGTRGRVMIGGKSAVVITTVNPHDGHKESVYVTDTAKPLLLRISEAGTGLVNFTGYGATKSLTPPPSSEVVSAG